MLLLHAHGGYNGTKAFLDHYYGKADASQREAGLKEVPVVIRTIYGK